MSLKKAYLYLVSVIALVIWVIGAIMLLNMALKTWVFPKADNYGYVRPSCVAMPAENTKDPYCDPQYAAEQERIEKENRASQKQRDAAQALAFIIVGVPVWWGHWRMARREQ